MKRSLYENIVDRFLLLHIISTASEIAPDLGKTKLQKLAFLSEWKLLDQRFKVLNYNYIKLVHGPYSNELNDDLTDFASFNIIVDPWIQPTHDGYAILDDFSDILDRNEEFIHQINNVVARFATFSLKKLLSVVYSLPHPYRRNITIEGTPFRTPLLYRIAEEKAIKKFEIDAEILEDLSICLHTDALKQWKEVKTDSRKGKSLTYREVFSVAEF